MTRSQLRQIVFDNSGRTDKTDVINRGLDFGLKTLSRLLAFLETRPEIDIALPVGVHQIQLPLSLSQIIELRHILPSAPTMSYPIELIRKTEFVSRYPNVAGSSITGRPEVAYRDGRKLFFDRISSEAAVIRLTYHVLDKFNNDEAEPTIVEADECLAAYATAYLFRSLEMFDNAIFWDREFNKLAQILINDSQNDLGVRVVAKQWTNCHSSYSSSAPWLDPFQGHGDSR